MLQTGKTGWSTPRHAVIDWSSDAAWSSVRTPLSTAVGLSPAAYTDDTFHAVEQARLFGRAWVVVGIAQDVAEVGPLLVREVGATSILITRGADGILRGFRNSCRHRGTELAEGDCDIAGTIRCPYHRWGYSTDGTLVSTPRFDDVPRDDFDRADYGLVEVRVATWGVLLFACLDDETPDLEVWLGDLPQRFAGYDLDAWRVHEKRDITIDANWKLISENFQEYYHLTWVHPELSKVSRVKDHYRFQGSGMYCGQTTTPVSADDRDDWMVMPPAAGLDASDGSSGRFIALFPNVLLSVLPNHVFVMQLDATGAGQTIERCAFLLPPSNEGIADDDFASTRAFWFDVNDEDIGIVERGQRGLGKGNVAPGPLAPRFEEPLHRFHNMLADLMTLDDLAELVVPPGDDGSVESRLGTAPNPLPARIDQARYSGDQTP